MCGISGMYNRSGAPIDRMVLQRMTRAIAHRGPDGEGFFVENEIGLGHRRLSIIDLEGGNQPIGNEDSTVQVIFNGEIYNFVELRKELQAFGHIFRTQSDTEVIVHAYEQWGRDCLSRLSGMFAFSVWDTKNKSLFLARDHLGIKPLYYSLIGDQLIFSSEIKALLTVPNCSAEVDVESLAELFTFRYVPSPKTLFRGIFKLPPGHFMQVDSKDISIERFWKTIPAPRADYCEAELISDYQQLLEGIIQQQMRSDVPVGLYLSSGIDSGVILALMREYSSNPVQTFTIGFKDAIKTNEVEQARATAHRMGARHDHQMISCEDYISYFSRYMRDLEEPVAHEPAPAFYFLAQLTGGAVKVALTGQGADEPWAGYDRYLGVKLSTAYSRLPTFVTGGIAPLIGKIPIPMERLKRGISSLAESDVLTRFAKIYSFYSEDMKEQLYKGELRRLFEKDRFGGMKTLRRLQGDVDHLDPLTQMLYIDTRANLPDDLLMVADKTSMANSLEVRVPFLDYRLIEFIESLPPQLKHHNLTGKYLHKKALRKWLTKEEIYRKKKGFAHPMSDWLRGPMKHFVDDCLLGSDSAVSQYFDQKYISKMLRSHNAGREDYMRHIYLMVSLELWHREYISV